MFEINKFDKLKIENSMPEIENSKRCMNELRNYAVGVSWFVWQKSTNWEVSKYEKIDFEV